MKAMKSITGAVVAAGLLLSQSASAQTAEPEVDEIGVPRSAQPLVWILLLVAAAVIVGLLFEDDGEDMPTSP